MSKCHHGCMYTAASTLQRHKICSEQGDASMCRSSCTSLAQSMHSNIAQRVRPRCAACGIGKGEFTTYWVEIAGYNILEMAFELPYSCSTRIGL